MHELIIIRIENCGRVALSSVCILHPLRLFPQEYLGQSSSTAGRRPEKIVRTVPVPWCQSGGTDTYRRQPSRKDLHDDIKMAYIKGRREFVR